MACVCNAFIVSDSGSHAGRPIVIAAVNIKSVRGYLGLKKKRKKGNRVSEHARGPRTYAQAIVDERDTTDPSGSLNVVASWLTRLHAVIAGAVVTVGVAVLEMTLLKVLPTRNSRPMRAMLIEMAWNKENLVIDVHSVCANSLFILVLHRKATRN